MKRRALVLLSLMERSYCQLRILSTSTPGYLTLSVAYILLPNKSPSNFFCLDLRITITVFLTLSKFKPNQKFFTRSIAVNYFEVNVLIVWKCNVSPFCKFGLVKLKTFFRESKTKPWKLFKRKVFQEKHFRKWFCN